MITYIVIAIAVLLVISFIGITIKIAQLEYPIEYTKTTLLNIMRDNTEDMYKFLEDINKFTQNKGD